MDEFNLLPIYRNGLEEITNGIEVVVPSFCRKNCKDNERCQKHYRKMAEAEAGLYQCPYGFSSYVFEIENDNYIFTCLRVEGKYCRKKLLPKLQGEGKEYREISCVTLEKYAEAYREYMVNQFKYERYKQFVDDVFHDVRKYNQQIKLKNEKLYRKSQQNHKYDEFLTLSKSIHVMCWFLTLRLNNHDFTYNEQLMTADVKSTYNIYKIIDKVRYCINDRAESKGIKIKMSSLRECRDMKAYDCIELLPFLILDNAIKYSPVGEKIHILFEEKDDRQHVCVTSLGPCVPEKELAFICNQGYRGENATKLTSDGMGIGLYTASCICKLNDIEMSVYSETKVVKNTKGIEYSNFKVDFWINL
ncbi:MAG: sensor histidine kinase [Lachnospiraceae bacterium]|nr:sensor histidine kinase [Lachnospiraceae bacterium]